MKIDQGVISRVAELARLDLSDDETVEFSRQLSDIIKYVEKINELDTGSVEPTDHIVELRNVLRSDSPGESMPVDDIKNIAPQFEDGHIVVPQIIEDH